MTVFLQTLCSSIKQIKPPYVFDWEHAIALHTMQGNEASSRVKGEVSWFCSSCSGNLGYILKLQQGLSFKAHICSAMSGQLSRYEGQLRNFLEAWQGNTDTSRGEVGTKGPFKVATVILLFLSIFYKFQASSPCEALHSPCLSRCQTDVRPPVQMRWKSSTFSRVSTGDSDIPLSCDIRDKPAFNTLQGNPTFFQVRASQCPFH